MLEVNIDNFCYMYKCLRLQLFKQKIIPSKRKDRLNDGNLKNLYEIFMWRVSIVVEYEPKFDA